MEESVLARAEPLGGEIAVVGRGVRPVREPAANDVDIGFLAGFEDAEVLLDRAVRRYVAGVVPVQRLKARLKAASAS